MLQPGTKAPDFRLPDQNGKEHTLDEYTGKGKKLLLYFYPKDNTSGCSKQAAAYSEAAAGFRERGIEIVGISKDSVASHKKFEEKYGLKFTILSDTEKTAVEAYDVLKEKNMYGKKVMGVVRTTYVIDENGVIIFANDKVKAADDAEKMSEMTFRCEDPA